MCTLFLRSIAGPVHLLARSGGRSRTRATAPARREPSTPLGRASPGGFPISAALCSSLWTCQRRYTSSIGMSTGIDKNGIRGLRRRPMPLCVSREGIELAAVGLLQIQGERQAIPKERFLSESNRASQADHCVPALKMRVENDFGHRSFKTLLTSSDTIFFERSWPRSSSTQQPQL